MNEPNYGALPSYGAQQPGGYPPPGPPQQGGGAIAVTLKYNPMTFIFGLLKPQLHIDGQQATNSWGRQVVPVAPGQHHLHIHIPYLLPPQVGPADLGVTVQPGQTVELEYRAPMIAFFNGALGGAPQKYPGMTLSLILLGVSLLILLCLCGGFLLAAIGSSNSSSSGLPVLPAAQAVLTQLTALLR
jgi:hypothetical protein